MIRLFASAAYRLAAIYAAAFVLTIIALGVAVFFAADTEVRQQLDAQLRIESAELVDEYRRIGLANLVATVAAREAVGGANSYDYALTTREGRQLAGRFVARRVPAGWHIVRGGMPGGGAARVLSTSLPGGERLLVATDVSTVEQFDRIILELVIAAISVAVLVALVGAVLLGGYLRRRLEAVGATAQAIARGNLSLRVPIGPRGDEFDRLGQALNAMLDRIAHLLENLRQVSSDVAHDLRTPLARLRGEIEVALGSGGTPPDRSVQVAALERALRQSDELLRLFAAILRISEVEGGALKRAFGPVDVSALVAELYEDYAPAIADGGRALSSAIAPQLIVHGDRELLAQALINLLDNAQRHTPVGTAVRIAAERVGSRAVRLVVADDGPGVPAADRERVVRRFVRLDSSRGQGGHGLGLNLVLAIALAHDGELRIDDNAPGLRVTVLLPVEPAPA